MGCGGGEYAFAQRSQLRLLQLDTEAGAERGENANCDMTTAIVWFQQDLRLADNPALLTAVRAARHVVPVYVWSPGEDGNWAPGAAVRWWLHESLHALDASLRARGSRLVFRLGPTAQALLSLARETGATQVYWNRRHEPGAILREMALRHELEDNGVLGHGFDSSYLAEPGTLRSSGNAPYRVFTPFHRAFVATVRVAAPEGSPPGFHGPIAWPSSLRLEDLQLLPDHAWYRSLAAHWRPGEAAARKALEEFVSSGLVNYPAFRDRPDLRATARISPHLRHGELSPRQVWAAVTAAGRRLGLPDGFEKEDKFCAELIWREFAAQQLVLSPSLPDRPRDARFENMTWRNEPPEFEAWTRGRTGFGMVDAGMRELWQTGWMHNRVRMITASFLVKNLLHDWRRGQRWFWDTLVDADLASNAYNWQWVAGCSPEASPWFRIFNPLEQARRYDPDGTYQQRYLQAALGNSVPMEPLLDVKNSRERALRAWARIATSSL